MGGDDVRLSPNEARDMSIIIITLFVYSRGFYRHRRLDARVGISNSPHPAPRKLLQVRCNAVRGNLQHFLIRELYMCGLAKFAPHLFWRKRGD